MRPSPGRRWARAPGKLVLLGEYAVLDGAGAVVAAVDRGVQCRVEPADTLRIETPGDDRFVRAALEGAPAARYRFEDWNPVDLPSKPGFGGSAAATVAAVLAAGRPGVDAFAVHHAVQGGGSGVDVHASLHGGVSRFPSPTPLSAPAGLEGWPLVAVWSGESAATGPRVRQYLAWPGREAFVARSAELLDLFPQEPLRALREAWPLLRAMAAGAGILYATDALVRIVALAEALGGAAKPSGAGGGDVAVALFPDPETRARFEAACAAEGLPTIAVRVVGPATSGAGELDAGE